MKKSDEDTIMEFPCRFPIKVMGIASDDFDIVITDIINKIVIKSMIPLSSLQ